MTEALEIVPYDPAWPGAFEAERERLARALGARALRIDHHRSTSVPGLAAKPILDIQVSVGTLEAYAHAKTEFVTRVTECALAKRGRR